MSDQRSLQARSSSDLKADVLSMVAEVKGSMPAATSSFVNNYFINNSEKINFDLDAFVVKRHHKSKKHFNKMPN